MWRDIGKVEFGSVRGPGRELGGSGDAEILSEVGGGFRFSLKDKRAEKRII